PVLALLLILGIPFFQIQLSTGQNLADLPPTPARIGFETLLAEFPGSENDPITAALTWEGTNLQNGITPERQEGVAAYVDEVSSINGVTDVESVLNPPPGMDESHYRALLAIPPDQRPEQVRTALDTYLADWIAGDTAKVRVFATQLPDSNEGRALVGEVRAVPSPDGAQVLTGGLPSRSADFMASFSASVPWAVLIVVLVTALVLFLTFGSVFLPIKAVLM